MNEAIEAIFSDGFKDAKCGAGMIVVRALEDEHFDLVDPLPTAVVEDVILSALDVQLENVDFGDAWAEEMAKDSEIGGAAVMNGSAEGPNSDGGSAREGYRSLQHDQANCVGKPQISGGGAEALQPRK